jgi:hypothetical protein
VLASQLPVDGVVDIGTDRCPFSVDAGDMVVDR